MNVRAILVIALASTLMTLPHRSEAASTEAAVAAFDRIGQWYAQAGEDEQTVGEALYLVYDGAVLARQFAGLADRVEGRPIDEGTIFHWASVTKTLTGVAVMQLVERGLLGLDDPAERYLPELREVHNPHGGIEAITIRHLLEHSAGFRSASWPWTDGANWQPQEPTSWEQIAAMMPYTEVAYEPGSRFSYSNLGYVFLGEIVERITGDSIEIYLKKNVLMPLGMFESYFDATPWYLRGRRTSSYTVSDEGIEDHGPELDTGITVANGGFNAPVADMVRFVNFLLRTGDNGNYDAVLKRATLEQMLAPRLPMAKDDRREISIGLAFFIADERDRTGAVHRYFGHSGFQRGYRTAIYLAADIPAAIVMAANTARQSGGNPSASEARVRIVDEVFPLLRGDAE